MYVKTLYMAILLVLTPHNILFGMGTEGENEYEPYLRIIRAELGIKQPSHVEIRNLDAIRNYDFETPLRCNSGQDDEIFKRRLQLLGQQLFKTLPKEEHINHLKEFSAMWPIIKETTDGRFADLESVGGFIVDPGSPENIFSKKETSIGSIIRLKRNIGYPVLHITDDVAISMVIRLQRCMLQRPTFEQQLNAISKYAHHNKDESKQSQFITRFLINDTLYKKLRDKPFKKKFDLHPSSDNQDEQAVYACYNNIPSLAIINEYFQQNQHAFKKELDGKISFNLITEAAAQLLPCYESHTSELGESYKTLYRRILTKIVKPHCVLPVEPVELLNQEQYIDKIDQVNHEKLDEKQYEPIEYHSRVKRWFNSNYIKNKNESSVRYHTLLPRIADSIIISDGVRSTWQNQRRPHKVDTLYRIPGRVTYNDGSNGYYIFEACINQNGRCYHRGYKKVNFDSINDELDAQFIIFDDTEHDGEVIGDIKEDNAQIINNNDYITELINPDYECKIVLFKPKEG